MWQTYTQSNTYTYICTTCARTHTHTHTHTHAHAHTHTHVLADQERKRSENNEEEDKKGGEGGGGRGWTHKGGDKSCAGHGRVPIHDRLFHVPLDRLNHGGLWGPRAHAASHTYTANNSYTSESHSTAAAHNTVHAQHDCQDLRPTPFSSPLLVTNERLTSVMAQRALMALGRYWSSRPVMSLVRLLVTMMTSSAIFAISLMAK